MASTPHITTIQEILHNHGLKPWVQKLLKKRNGNSKYMPHQGKREMERRRSRKGS